MIIAPSNETVSEYAIPYYLDRLNNLLMVVGLSSSAIGLIGNCTVLALIFGSKKFRRPANFYVANLSVTSLMYILITNVRFYAGRPHDALNHQLPICLLMAFLGKFTHALIAFTTLTIVVDRNYRVKHPMSVPSKRSLLHFIGLIWVGAICVTIPRIYMFDLQTVSDEEHSVTHQGVGHEALVSMEEKRCLKTILWNSETAHICYLCIYFLTVTFVPISVAIMGLVKISKVINILHACHRWNKDVSNIRHRILRNTFIFAVLFILCWGPSGIVMFLTDFPPNLMPGIVSDNFKFFKYFNIVGFVQNSLNPILLFILSSDLREYIYKTKTLVCGHHEPVK